ncbi:MAG TPA: MgtC/SapB family protein [Candidatus Bilophila faecipullorum]|uniref:MgtC/SapB family protein n=1 Tax=Candidatus Bilophila faecipullorum TaxID=2838482 RepID=A0A9D1U8A3_9BACT|nr:MgtC/SapB family protein [uncultured Bilophila sp.]HIW78404.1 MgtC/SapB family protein [Candidatus Bilophila faecipullorum]
MILTPYAEMEFFARILVAALCGAFIGYERNNRLKEAGIRTHLIVALAAALIMVVSKYGFGDVTTHPGIALDPSRIAAQIVTGVGFLGAGMIFVRNQNISGLTTAAGVWATAGIGMAVGAGLYFLGIGVSLLIIAAQMMLHRNFAWLHFPMTEQISLEMDTVGDGVSSIREKLLSHEIHILSLKARHLDNGRMALDIFVKVPKEYNRTQLMSLLSDNPHIKSLDL